MVWNKEAVHMKVQRQLILLKKKGTENSRQKITDDVDTV